MSPFGGSQYRGVSHPSPARTPRVCSTSSSRSARFRAWCDRCAVAQQCGWIPWPSLDHAADQVTVCIGALTDDEELDVAVAAEVDAELQAMIASCQHVVVELGG